MPTRAGLAACDLPRRNDLDGRGNLSEETLAEFTRFFLETCIDQVKFMEELVQPDRLRDRILLWAEEEIRGRQAAAKIGPGARSRALPRRASARRRRRACWAPATRHARRIVSALLERGVLTSDSTRAPLRLDFPAALASRWMPGL